jgi:hypothetical protein
LRGAIQSGLTIHPADGLGVFGFFAHAVRRKRHDADLGIEVADAVIVVSERRVVGRGRATAAEAPRAAVAYHRTARSEKRKSSITVGQSGRLPAVASSRWLGSAACGSG